MVAYERILVAMMSSMGAYGLYSNKLEHWIVLGTLLNVNIYVVYTQIISIYQIVESETYQVVNQREWMDIGWIYSFFLYYLIDITLV